MDSVADDGFLCRRVSPFGNLRIDAYVPLPGAYRSLSRPSSAPDAKAFPLCSSSLNLLVLKNYAGSIRFSVCRNCYPLSFHNLLQTFAFCCLACPLLSVQFSMCSEGTYAVPSKLNNAENELPSWPDLGRSGLPRQTSFSLERR